MMKSKFICCFCFVLVLLNSNIIYALELPLEEPFFILSMLTGHSDYNLDYAFQVAKCLTDLNIKVEVRDYYEIDLKVYSGNPPWAKSWDLLIGKFSDNPKDIRAKFTEEGTLNIFGLNKEITYYSESEKLLNQVYYSSDLDDKHQLLYDWCKLLMDKMLPYLPFFSQRFYEALWSNIKNYDMRWGLSNSLPYMEYEGYHEMQDSLDEFNIADAMFHELNPLFSRDEASDFIISLISEPLIVCSPDHVPLKTGLIYDWEQISNNHFKLYLRENIFWNPSYNITTNHDDSSPIEDTPLMYGLKGEYSNGTNQLLTARDAVFTLLTYANNITNIDSFEYNWLSDCYIDEVNPFSFHIKIDSNPQTSEMEPYVDFLNFMSIQVLPEFFLNSTSSSISYTEGGIKCWGLYPEIINTIEWEFYSKSAFNCGKYLIYYILENSLTVLQRNPLWFGVGAIDGYEGTQPFVERINIRCIQDPKEVLSEFQMGKLELTDVTNFPAERKDLQVDARFEVQTEIADSHSFMAFNLRRPIIGGEDDSVLLESTGKEEYTKALAVRKAICYAIDREEINQIYHDGEYSIKHYPYFFFPYYHYYWIDVVRYNRDLNTAWEWMEAAGYKNPEATSWSEFSVTIFALSLLLIPTSHRLKLEERRKQQKSARKV